MIPFFRPNDSMLHLLAFVYMLACGNSLAAEAAEKGVISTPILQGNADILGAPIVYPAGEAEITAVMVTIPPGVETGWHSHLVPLFGQVVSGVLTVDYGSKGVRKLRPGDALLEAVNWPHNGINYGDVPVEIFVIYVGAKGAPNSVKHESGR
jgi:quercetin dioxygenase-like cupin family protein